MPRHRLPFLLLLILAAHPAGAQQRDAAPGDWRRGETLAEQHCAACHRALPADQWALGTGAVAFQTLPGRGLPFLRAFMARAHPRMPFEKLSPDDREDILAYMLQLLPEEIAIGQLRDAVDGYRVALQRTDRTEAPLQWAAAQHTLGNALVALGLREDGTARLDEALGAFRAAQEIRTRDAYPLDWAMTETSLGLALAEIGARTGDRAALEAARRAVAGAAEAFLGEGHEQYGTYFEDRLAEIDARLKALGDR